MMSMLREATRLYKAKLDASQRKRFRRTDEGKMMVDGIGMARVMLRVEREWCYWLGMGWQIVSTAGTADDVVSRCEMVLAVEAVGDQWHPPTVPEAMAKMIEGSAAVFWWAAASSCLEKCSDPKHNRRGDRLWCDGA